MNNKKKDSIQLFDSRWNEGLSWWHKWSSFARWKAQINFLLNNFDSSKRIIYNCLQRCMTRLEMNKSQHNSIQIFQSLYIRDLQLSYDLRLHLLCIVRIKMTFNYLSQSWKMIQLETWWKVTKQVNNTKEVIVQLHIADCEGNNCNLWNKWWHNK
jgi:hypothetical protein